MKFVAIDLAKLAKIANLSATDTDGHVWAEHYDRDLADIFAVQDEISQAVTMIAIAPAISQTEQLTCSTGKH